MQQTQVLLIDDDIRVGQLLQRLLFDKRYNITVVNSGAEGIKIAQTKKIDIIFCDIMMPELDGYGVLKQLKADEATKNIPFFFLTAKTETEDLLKGISMGATGYYTKPVTREDLIEAIQENVIL